MVQALSNFKLKTPSHNILTLSLRDFARQKLFQLLFLQVTELFGHHLVICSPLGGLECSEFTVSRGCVADHREFD